MHDKNVMHAKMCDRNITRFEANVIFMGLKACDIFVMHLHVERA